MPNLTVRALLRVGVLFLVSSAAWAAPPLDLEGAKWIWDKKAGNAAGTWYFRKEFAFPAGQKPKKAKVLITCDNTWVLYANGKRVGQGTSWGHPRSVDVAEHLTIERNSLAVEGGNTAPGPAGLLVKLHVGFEGSKDTFGLVSDESWVSTDQPEKGWREDGFVGGERWSPVAVLGAYGIEPWGKPRVGGAGGGVGAAPKVVPVEVDPEELKKPIYRDGVVFVGSDCGLNPNRQKIYVQNVRGTRAYFEMDPMTPAALGRELWRLAPLSPDGEKTLLCDAGQGSIGSPSVSYDGKTVYFTMARPGEAYFHIYKIDLTGKGELAPGEDKSITQLTDGPFHDYDPVELPDGRIAFSSTRLGSREEYHAKYASSLFTLDPGSGKIRPLTYHIVADREPRVTADGSLVFIRVDNFLERAKVEVHLHQTRLDGTGGQVIIGPGRGGVRLDRDVAGESSMRWLRKFGVGSPAPMTDGRVAAINQSGLVTSGTVTGEPVGGGFKPYDLSPLPDGRLLCTGSRKNLIIVFDPGSNEQVPVFSMAGIHSVVHLGARKRPPARPAMSDPQQERRIDKTGFLYCQNARHTQHTAADTRRIKAIRAYEGRPFTLEPTKSIYEHIGTVGVELGTVPLAEDGSFYVEVPADRPIALQAVDGEGRAVINELSWIYTRPGEKRSCVGCHAPPEAAPARTTAKAARARPLRLTGQGQPHRFRANNGANGGIVNLQLDKLREVVAVDLHNVPDDGGLSTIRKLGILRERSAVPTLIKALTDESSEMRCAAAMSLSACGDRRAVKPLMTALSDAHPTVVRAATCALEHLTGNPEGGTDWPAIEKALIERILPEQQLAELDAPQVAIEEESEPVAAEIVIKSALYGVKGNRAKQMDLKEKIEARVAAGQLTFSANYAFAGGDPAPGIHKTTELEYMLNGKLTKVSLREGEEFDLARGPAPAGSGKTGQDAHMAIEALGHVGGDRGKRALRMWLKTNPNGELRIMMAAIRSLGYLRDVEAIPDLVAIINANLNRRGKGGWGEGGFGQKPTYLSATAAEALGRIGGAEAEEAILAAAAKLGSFESHVMFTGDHGWLRSAQASPVYFRMLEALDRAGSTGAGPLVEKLVISLPSDKDRGLLYELDSYEQLVGRVIQRSGRMDDAVEACLAELDGTAAGGELVAAVSKAPHNEKHIRKLSPQARAAQVLSIVCMDKAYADRIRAVLLEYRAQDPSETRSWVCFMLTRALGRLGDEGSIDLFVEMLQQDPTEASLGLNPPPQHIIYKAWRPFYRPAAAWALGELGARSAVPALLEAVREMENASSTREQAAIALGKVGDRTLIPELEEVADEYPEVMTRRALLASVAALSGRERR